MCFTLSAVFVEEEETSVKQVLCIFVEFYISMPAYILLTLIDQAVGKYRLDILCSMFWPLIQHHAKTDKKKGRKMNQDLGRPGNQPRSERARADVSRAENWRVPIWVSCHFVRQVVNPALRSGNGRARPQSKPGCWLWTESPSPPSHHHIIVVVIISYLIHIIIIYISYHHHITVIASIFVFVFILIINSSISASWPPMRCHQAPSPWSSCIVT
jgi:hypothetical protein